MRVALLLVGYSWCLVAVMALLMTCVVSLFGMSFGGFVGVYCTGGALQVHWRCPNTAYAFKLSPWWQVPIERSIGEQWSELAWVPRYISGRYFRMASIPLWMLIVLPMSFIVISHRRRGMNKTTWSCVNCGYDLRGSTSGICSECGHAYEARDGER